MKRTERQEFTGACGSKEQVCQLGDIEAPITANFPEGLSVISCAGPSDRLIRAESGSGLIHDEYCAPNGGSVDSVEKPLNRRDHGGSVLAAKSQNDDPRIVARSVSPNVAEA